MTSARQLSTIDRLVGQIDDALRTTFGQPPKQRPTPTVPSESLKDTSEMEISARLMRVNHTGEVCAQALYQAQAVTARSQSVRTAMERASREENDHLCWCDERLQQLDSHKSYLNPVWYGGAFVIGATFGMMGDSWSLGFLAETERQVVAHLEDHLQRLPEDDHKSRAILEQMRSDEAAHATQAVQAGARELPPPVKRLMSLASTIMTTTAARI